MILILEVILAVAAWRKGWHGMALLPLAGAFVAAFVLSLLGAPAVIGIASDLAAIAILAVTIKQAPTPAQLSTHRAV